MGKRFKYAAPSWRRDFWTRAGLAALTASLILPLTGTAAQEAQPSRAPRKGTRAAQSKGKKTSKKRNGPTLRVVPMSRQQAAPPGGKPALPPMPAGAQPVAAAPNPAGGGGVAPMAAGAIFSFDFHGSDIDNVLQFYARVSNLTVTKDPALTGQVTIINPKQVTLDEAFKILQSVLFVRGFTAIQDGMVLRIVPLDRAVGSTPLVNPDVKPGTIDARDQVMTQVIPLENVDAEALSKELMPLINKGASLIGSAGSNALIVTDTASNVQRFIKLVDALDKTSNRTEMRIYPLRHAEATVVADIITNIYKQTTTRGRGAPPQPGQPQPPPPQPGQPAPMGSGRPAVVAVADARTNSVIVVASPDNQDEISRKIIQALDGDEANTLQTKTRKIKYADAVTVANLINSVLTNMHVGGSANPNPAGASFQARAFGGFGGEQPQTQTVTSADPFGKVVADPRTNTLLLTASAERMPEIEQLIDQLDVDVPVEPTTFVIPLKNAQADDVAYALSQAFNTAQNNFNPFGGFFFFGGGGQGNRGGRRQRIQRRLGSQNNNNPFRSATRPDGRAAPPPSAAQASGGVPPGDVSPPDSEGDDPRDGQEKERTRQYYDYGFGRRRGIGQGGGPQYGRGRTGTYSNLLQLQNNVFVTASPGGDSLIVTTTPDNYQAVKEIIEALDVVPRQVMIEAIIAEVTLDSDQRTGLALSGKFFRLFSGNNNAQGAINLPAQGFSPTFDPLATGGQFVLHGANYDALIQALTSDSKVKVLSTPRIFTGNNQEAEIDITTNIPYVQGQNANGFINTTVSNELDFLNVGIILNVIPRITREGLVTIEVQQEASDLLRFDILGTGVSAIRAPVVDDRYTDTAVTVQDGDTIVIGGLIRDSDSLNVTKIPILSEIPLIGQFFRSRQKVRNKTELMIFITPHVINSAAEAREMTRKQGASIIKQLPDLPKQQPNLDPKRNLKPAETDQKQPGPEKSEAPSSSKSGSPPPSPGR
ncbi:MAG TPA: secretin N-terminal domain-containing protein [Chthonomonadaceae bacterium]|nr:secretin N-terminal domain-containing protein [Chthonomonadaceae bacterium]